MSGQTKLLVSCLLFFILSLVSASSHAWDVTPLDITRMEGESAVIKIIIDQDEWELSPPNCRKGQWGVEFTGVFEDGTADWGKDIEKPVSTEEITGVCSWEDPTDDLQTTVRLKIEFLEDPLIEFTEQAKIVFDYCEPDEAAINAAGSELQETCFQRIVSLTVEDTDQGVYIETFTAEPESIFLAEATTLTWSVANAVECEASGGGGGWDEMEISLPEGSTEITFDEEGSYEFVLTCTGATPDEGGGETEPKKVSSSVTVLVELEPNPDLDVVRVSLSTTSLTTGEGFSIEAEIRNEGLGPSSPTEVNYLLSMNNVIDDSDVLLAQSVMPGIEVDELFTATAHAVAPPEPGGYWVGVCVDGLPSELHYGNNCSRAKLISVSGNSCQSSEVACGEAKSGAISSLDCDSGPLGQGHYARSFQLDGRAGDTVWFDAAWSFDGYLLLDGPGGFVVAENDNYTSTSDSRIEHTFEESGRHVLWLTSYAPQDSGEFDLSVDCDGGGGPDLVSNIPVDGILSVRPGEPVSVLSDFANMGDAESDSSTMRWMLSSDSTISTSDTQLALKTVAPLASGGIGQETVDITAPATPGRYWIGTCVDAIAGEAATSNNCSNAMSLSVSEPPACFTSGLACGGTVNDSLNANDCHSGPRGAGHYAQKYTLNATVGEPLSLRSDWTDVDGMLYLLDPDGKVVADNDDNPDTAKPQSLIEYLPAQTGKYVVWTTTYGRSQAGSFRLFAECGESSAPDLVTTASLASDAAVTVGDTVVVNYTITNTGDAPADATRVLMLLSGDPVISRTDKLLETQRITSLTAGSSTSMDMEVTVPGIPGDYWIGPCAEAVAGEIFTGNNCTVPVSQSLLLESDRSSRSKLRANGAGGLLLNVSSGSECPSLAISCGQSQQGILQSSDCDSGPRGSGYLTDAYTFNGSAGTVVSLNASWTEMDGYLYLQSPSGSILAVNDDFGGGTDSRIEWVLTQSGEHTVWPTAFEQGQGGNYELDLTCDEPDSPDLEVSQLTLSTTTVRPGQSLSVAAQVSNRGNISSVPSEMRYILSTNESLTGDARVLQRSDIPALVAGSNSDQALQIEIDTIPGAYYIGACAETEAIELDTSNNCRASGPVFVEQTDLPIAFNTGLNDAWYNPDTDGQGFFINVFPDNNLVFLSWFTFDTERPPESVPFKLGDPGHRWLTAQGFYDQGIADLTVFLTAGGVFDSDEPPASSPLGYGKMTLSFSDCNNGTVDFDLASSGESGTIPITRVVNDNVRACEEQLGGIPGGAPDENSADSTFTYNRALNDAWFDPTTNGQGFFFNVYPGLNSVFLSWFTYDVERPPDGTPFNLGEPGHRWLTAQGSFSGDTADLTVNSTGGGVFNQGMLPPGSTVEDGSIMAIFENCNSAVVNYDIDSIDQQGQIPVERIVGDSIPDCEQQSQGGGSSEGISPDKDTLQNRCAGSVDWRFDWPEVENASYYVFELYRSDSQEDSPRVTAFPESSQLDYAGKESRVDEQHLENWRWRYLPILDSGSNDQASWSDFYGFSVKPPGYPCIE